MQRPIQNLREFKIPANFRGKPAWVVQLWWLVQATLFRCSPQVLYGWRRWLLRLFGARIGRGVLIRATAEITYPWKLTIGDWSWIGDNVTLYTLGEIYIGENAVVSQQCYLCTGSHDYTSPSFDIFSRPVRIDTEAWLAAGVFVAPGVNIGRGVVVAMRSVVTHDLPSMMVCFGSPAEPRRPRFDQAPRSHERSKLAAVSNQ